MLMQEMVREVPWPVWGAVTTFFLTATGGVVKWIVAPPARNGNSDKSMLDGIQALKDRWATATPLFDRLGTSMEDVAKAIERAALTQERMNDRFDAHDKEDERRFAVLTKAVATARRRK
jgi:hypothetical protein